jgi:hypothetical protein
MNSWRLTAFQGPRCADADGGASTIAEMHAVLGHFSRRKPFIRSLLS